MKHGWSRSIWFAVIAVLLVIGSSAALAQEQSQASANQSAAELLTLNISQQQQQAAEAFWTPEMRSKAPLMALPSISDDSLVASAAQPQSAEPPQVLQGQLADAKMDELARQLYPQAWIAVDTQLKSAALAPQANATQATDGFSPYTAATANFNRYPINSNSPTWTSYPYRTIGRLFFTVPGSGQASCTATVVASRGVLTAGHCLFTPGRGWHGNFIFYPAFRFNTAPYGGFTPFSGVVLGNWARYAARSDDVAMLAIRDKSGYTIGQWVGWLGLGWNGAYNQLMHAFGYPGNIGNGQYSSVCVGESWAQTLGGVVGMGCDMTYGSSGGPWLARYYPFALGNIVNSVVSGGNPSIPKFYGPYFDTDNIGQLWNWVRTK